MNEHIPELKSLPEPNFLITPARFLPAIFSLHKQCLQSESALIKGTNLSRSNRVAALGRAADNSGLFDQKYIIFSGAACLDAFVWGQEIGEVIAPCWCSPSLLRLLAGEMKATPIISENTPNELSRVCWVQLEPPTPQCRHNSLSMHNSTKDTVNSSSFLPFHLCGMRLSGDGVAVQLRSLEIFVAPI